MFKSRKKKGNTKKPAAEWRDDEPLLEEQETHVKPVEAAEQYSEPPLEEMADEQQRVQSLLEKLRSRNGKPEEVISVGVVKDSTAESRSRFFSAVKTPAKKEADEASEAYRDRSYVNEIAPKGDVEVEEFIPMNSGITRTVPIQIHEDDDDASAFPEPLKGSRDVIHSDEVSLVSSEDDEMLRWEEMQVLKGAQGGQVELHLPHQLVSSRRKKKKHRRVPRKKRTLEDLISQIELECEQVGESLSCKRMELTTIDASIEQFTQEAQQLSLDLERVRLELSDLLTHQTELLNTSSAT